MGFRFKKGDEVFINSERHGYNNIKGIIKNITKQYSSDRYPYVVKPEGKSNAYCAAGELSLTVKSKLQTLEEIMNDLDLLIANKEREQHEQLTV